MLVLLIGCKYNVEKTNHLKINSDIAIQIQTSTFVDNNYLLRNSFYISKNADTLSITLLDTSYYPDAELSYARLEMLAYDLYLGLDSYKYLKLREKYTLYDFEYDTILNRNYLLDNYLKYKYNPRLIAFSNYIFKNFTSVDYARSDALMSSLSEVFIEFSDSSFVGLLYVCSLDSSCHTNNFLKLRALGVLLGHYNHTSLVKKFNYFFKYCNLKEIDINDTPIFYNFHKR